MEVDVIHRKHEGLIFRSWCLVAPMTLEREVVLRILLIDILDGYAAFYAAHSEAGAGRKAGYYARLPLQWRHHCLVRGSRVCEIEYLDVALCGADYHEWVRDVERVAALGELNRRDRI